MKLYLIFENFIFDSRKIYLDTNATTPLADEVYDKICEVLKNHWANPSSCHAKG